MPFKNEIVYPQPYDFGYHKPVNPIDFTSDISQENTQKLDTLYRNVIAQGYEFRDIVPNFCEGKAVVVDIQNEHENYCDENGRMILRESSSSIGNENYYHGKTSVFIENISRFAAIDKEGDYIYGKDNISQVILNNGNYIAYIEEYSPYSPISAELFDKNHTLLLRAANIEVFEDTYLKVETFNGEIDLYSFDGKCLLGKNYLEISNFENGLAKIAIAGKTTYPYNTTGYPEPIYEYWYGFIDENLNEVCQPIYNSISYPLHGFCIASKDGKFGIVDDNFSEYIPLMYSQIAHFSEGLARVQIITNTKESYKDIVAFTPAGWDGGDYFDEETGFEDFDVDTKVTLHHTYKYGFLNRSNELKIPAIYEDAYDFYLGRAFVKQEGQWIIIDKDGKKVSPLAFDEIAYKFYKNFTLALANNNWGVIDIQGNIVIPFEFEKISINQEYPWILQATRFNKSHLINMQGNLPSVKAFNDLICNEYGSFIFTYNGKEGVLSAEGTIVVDAIYENIIEYSKNYLVFSDNKRYGVITKLGEVVLEPDYDEIDISHNLKDCCFKVRKSQFWGITDLQGNIIIPIAYALITDIFLFKDNLVRILVNKRSQSFGYNNPYFKDTDEREWKFYEDLYTYSLKDKVPKFYEIDKHLTGYYLSKVKQDIINETPKTVFPNSDIDDCPF